MTAAPGNDLSDSRPHDLRTTSTTTTSSTTSAANRTATAAGRSARTPAKSRSERSARASYSGPERRTATPIPHTTTQIVRTSGVVALILLLWVSVLMMVRAHGVPALHGLLSLTHSIAGALLLIGAAQALAIWRVTRTSRTAGAIVALTAAGLATPLTGVLARTSASGLTDRASSGLLAAAIELAIIACLAASLRGPAVRTDLTPLRYAGVLAALIVLGAGLVLARGSIPSPAFVDDTANLVRAANVVGWLLIAAMLVIGGLRQQRKPDVLLGASLVLVAAAAFVTYRLGPIAYQGSLLAAGFDLFVASTVAGTASVILWRLHAGHTMRLNTMESELQATRTDLAILESSQDRRLHDARNAIFAIAGAVDLLARPTPHAPLAPAHLQRLITAELSRLGHLLDPAFHGEATSFTAHDLLDPLIEAYRAHGLTITANLDDSTLTGRRDLLAGAVTNILTNARVHAPGARIWVSTATVYDAALDGLAVRIDIADDGPGIPSDQRDAVLLPGVRGAGVDVPGSGLGLASAAQALSEARGTLRLSERKGGGTMITLTLPSAPSTTPVAGDNR